MAAPTAPRIVTRADIDGLLANKDSAVLTIYHPTERAVVQPEENSLHLKNLLGTATEKLERKGFRRKELDHFLAPLEAMLEERDLWMNQLSGLAIFRTMESFETFRLPYRAPEMAHVGDAPYLTPLLPSLWPEQRFFVLALSQNAIRLVHCTRFAAAEVDLADLDMPRSIAEALRYDDLQKPELQHHPTTGPGRSSEGQGGETGRQQRGRRHDFHGHGEDGDEQKDQITRFFQGVDRGLHEIFRNQHIPLILAGVDYLHPIYREVSDYPTILTEHIEGNFDRESVETLHEKALPIIEKRQRAELDELRERFGSAGAHGLASSDLGEILQATTEGRIEVLFVRGTEPRWGRYDESTDQLTFADAVDEFGDAEDLHDRAARATIQASGEVYVLGSEEMPTDAHIAALFRYNPAIQRGEEEGES